MEASNEEGHEEDEFVEFFLDVHEKAKHGEGVD